MKGKRYANETRTFQDKATGRKVTQLTDQLGHSCHLYFTNNTFYNKDIVFKAQRGGATNLFRLHSESGEISQLTDLHSLPYEKRVLDRSQHSFVHEGNQEVYVFYDNQVYAVHLETLKERILYTAPDGFMLSSGSPSSDGNYLLICILEYLAPREEGYGFYETWATFPLSHIIRIDIQSAKAEIIHSENYWLGHINMSTTVPNLMTFCHEGPWHEVDHRIWLLNTDNGELQKIVKDHGPAKTSGHEYWLADGIHIGYHGNRLVEGKREGYFGYTKYDNSECIEINFPFRSQHFHSNDMNLIVGDGNREEAPYILLWRLEGQQYGEPIVLAKHRCSSHIQATHVHPRFTPDGRQVLFTSDTSGYGNMYLIEADQLDALPLLKEIKQSK
jgi:oligogalacturonide lyase